MENAAGAKLDDEFEWLNAFAGLNGPSTLSFLAVALDIHDAVEGGVLNVDCDLDAIGQTVNNNIWPWEVRVDLGRNDGCYNVIKIIIKICSIPTYNI